MTELPHYSYYDLLLWLQKVVAEKGEDYTYPTPQFFDELTQEMEEADGECLYFTQEVNEKGQVQLAPSCIVGHVLDAANIYHPTTEVPYWNGLGVGSDLFEAAGFTTDEAGSTLLHAAQRLQDDGVPWGDVLRQAQARTEEKYPELKS